MVLVSRVQLHALVEEVDEFSRLSHPELGDIFAFADMVFAVLDHLVGYLHEQMSHPFTGVVVPSDRVYHLHRVHECRQSLYDLLRSPCV